MKINTKSFFCIPISLSDDVVDDVDDKDDDPADAIEKARARVNGS